MNTDPWSTVGQGTQSPAVTAIQYFLRARGAVIAVDGVYGAVTAAAVLDFQDDAGLVADGTVGPQTWPQLIIPSQQGSEGDAVRAVQQFGLLRFPGDPPLVVDGDYGPVTAERITAFQERNGLTVDGVAGPETWSFLSTATPGPRPWPLVKVGATQDTNYRVLPAQYLLRAHGAAIAADGIFGPISGAAVTAFQQTLRDTELGTTLGQLDWPDLIITVGPGDNGDAVRAVQELRPGLVVDGDFGPLTEASVREFQDVFLPPSDGIVGPETWHALIGGVFD